MSYTFRETQTNNYISFRVNNNLHFFLHLRIFILNSFVFYDFHIYCFLKRFKLLFIYETNFRFNTNQFFFIGPTHALFY